MQALAQYYQSKHLMKTVFLGISIEESDTPTKWTTFDGKLTQGIEIPDTKKFHRLAVARPNNFLNLDQSK